MLTTERNTQIVIELLKYHGIKRVIASPGATNVSFIASIQNDSFFELYSCVDERSAAYIACGMAAESGDPVVLSCTGATASRNYLPGLTEAYYRHLPVLAITSTMPIVRIGHNVPQCIDRTRILNDIVYLSVHLPIVKDEEDEWICNLRANEAMLELDRKAGGPVHINLESNQGGTFDAKDIKTVKPIDRYYHKDNFPVISGKNAIFVGSHLKWNMSLTKAVETFCEKYNAVVFVDQTSNYKGKYACQAGIISAQKKYKSNNLQIDNLIHIGDVSGAYMALYPKKVWRVASDGRLCDYYKALRYVFEMDEFSFFQKMNDMCSNKEKNTSFYSSIMEEYTRIKNKIGELPFSNLWVAQNLSKRLPPNSVLHLGILNSLRSWNFVEVDKSIDCYSNVGGFGIDGCVSTLLGAALMKPDTLFFGVVGDLAFFYDMNVLGNRHFAKNLRLIVINNGRGQEFKNYGHRAAQFGDETDKFIAAAGHYQGKGDSIISSYVKSCGYKYIAVSNKEEFSKVVGEFSDTNMSSVPMIMEIFTNTDDETEALHLLCETEVARTSVADEVKKITKSMLGEAGVSKLKKLIRG